MVIELDSSSNNSSGPRKCEIHYVVETDLSVEKIRNDSAKLRNI